MYEKFWHSLQRRANELIFRHTDKNMASWRCRHNCSVDKFNLNTPLYVYRQLRHVESAVSVWELF